MRVCCARADAVGAAQSDPISPCSPRDACTCRGKRKSSAKPPPKKAKPKLALSFDCPFCGHEKTCDVKIDKDRSFAEIKCNICAASYTTNTHKLTQPVDVYAEWIDECDAVNKDGGADADNEDGLDAGLRRGGDDDEEDDGYDREQHATQDDDWRQDDDDA
jgi:transcription elongation factor Elf1